MAEASNPLKLPETLDTAAAPALLEALRERRGAALVLDASALRWIGAACAQLLLAAVKAWRVDRRTLSIVDLGEEPKALLALMGVEPASLRAD